MNSKSSSLLFLFLWAAVMMACSSRKMERDSGAKDPGEWPEMESFHRVMAEAYHPYVDSSNVEPVKSLAENLATESATWADAPLPAAVDNADVKAKLEKLKKDCRALSDQIKAGATNEQIGKYLTALHESFHAIMEEWEKGKDHKP